MSESARYPSLFDPDTDEEFSDESSSDLEELTHAPLLHINVSCNFPLKLSPYLSPSLQEVIKEPLQTFSAALDVLLPRMKPSADVKGISLEDQQSFVSISYSQVH